jgi:hypothetical protein
MAMRWVKALGSHSVRSKELAKGFLLVRLTGSERVRAKGTRMVQGSALGSGPSSVRGLAISRGVALAMGWARL